MNKLAMGGRRRREYQIDRSVSLRFGADLGAHYVFYADIAMTGQNDVRAVVGAGLSLWSRKTVDGFVKAAAEAPNFSTCEKI